MHRLHWLSFCLPQVKSFVDLWRQLPAALPGLRVNMNGLPLSAPHCIPLPHCSSMPSSLSSLISQVKSFVDLWRQLQAALPDLGLDKQGCHIKVVYMDAAGDWVMAMPDQRWQSFVEVAQRVLVTTGC